MLMGLIGYARISTSEGRQVLDRQLDALGAAECERVFQDTASGADATRPGLVACLDHLRRNDVLVVLDLDRLGRLAHDLIALIDGLEKRGVGFKAINSPMDTTTPAGRAFLQIQAAFAEMGATSSANASRKASSRREHGAEKVAGRGS